MSDSREAGDAAFRGPRILIWSFLSDRLGRLVRGQATCHCDLLPNLDYQIVGGRLAAVCTARPGVRAAALETSFGPMGAGEAEVIGAGEAIADAVVDILGADTDVVIRLRPEEILAAPTVEVGG